jgi:phenylalanyl-tRNA synthetase beta chain
VWTGASGTEHWSTPPREVDFFDAKGVVDQLCGVLGVPTRTVAAGEPFLVAGQAATVLSASTGANDVIGFIGVLSPAVADARGLPRHDPVIVAELDLDAIHRLRVAQPDVTRAIPRFPFVVRDLSIVVANALPAEIIRGTILSAARGGAAPLVSIAFFDRYQGKGVPAESISVSLRLTFQAEDRTLTDAEVQQSFEAILAALVREHGAVQR